MAVEVNPDKLLKFGSDFIHRERRRSDARLRKLEPTNTSEFVSPSNPNPVPEVLERMRNQNHEVAQIIEQLHLIVLLQIVESMKADKR
jgi:hypothetical protein